MHLRTVECLIVVRLDLCKEHLETHGLVVQKSVDNIVDLKYVCGECYQLFAALEPYLFDYLVLKLRPEHISLASQVKPQTQVSRLINQLIDVFKQVDCLLEG